MGLHPHDTILCDKNKMGQVLRNLLSNALKFSKRGETITVRTGFSPHKKTPTKRNARPHHDAFKKTRFHRVVNSMTWTWKDASPTTFATNDDNNNDNNNTADDDDDDEWTSGDLIVIVTDSGAGISRENQRLLFREGMQFNPEKLQAGGGSGFGLFISKTIVGLHDGKIRAFSAGEGQGSSFMFKIPMRRKEGLVLDPEAQHHPHQHQPPHGLGLRQGRLLGLGLGPGLSAEEIDFDDGPQLSSFMGEAVLYRRPDSRTSSPALAIPRRSILQGKAGLGAQGPGLGAQGHGPGEGEGQPLSASEKAAYRARRVTFPPPQEPPLPPLHHPHPHPPAPPMMVVEDPAVLNEGTSSGGGGGIRDKDVPSSLVRQQQQQQQQQLTRGGASDSESNLRLTTTSIRVDKGAIGGKDDDTTQVTSPPVSVVVTGVVSPAQEGVLTGKPSPTLATNASIAITATATAIATVTTASATTSTRRPDRSLTPTLPPVGNNGARYHLLVVDDSAMSRKMMMKTLKGVGHTCEEAEDGAQAVQKVQERLSAQDINSSSGSSGRRNEGSSCSSNNSSSNNSPSASPRPSPCFHGILMDFVMPVMDGPDATKAIRSLGFIGPIIGCTGNTLDGDLKRFKENGCHRVIGKPFDLTLFHSYMTEDGPR